MIAQESGARRARHVRGLLVAALAIGGLLVASAPARAEFGLESFKAVVHEPFDAPMPFLLGELPPVETLTPALQAGAHSDLTLELAFKTELDPVSGETIVSGGAVRDIEVDLPPGFYGNPQGIAECELGDLIEDDQGLCPADAQVGIAHVRTSSGPPLPQQDWLVAPIYNVRPDDDETAALAFAVYGVPIKMSVGVRSDGDYGLRTSVRRTNQAFQIHSARITIWGVPADPSNDDERWDPLGVPALPFPPNGHPSGAVRRAFFTTAPRCDGPLPVRARVRSWQEPDRWLAYEAVLPQQTGCDRLRFEPSVRVRPESSRADAPTAYTVDVEVPQEEDPDGLSTAHVDDVVVDLPEGVAISPSSAGGLEACPDERANLGRLGLPDCPLASRIGTVEITTPVLAEKLTGHVILREPRPGNLFRLLIVARGPGIVVKLPGEAHPDKETGAIRAVFENNPQLPFSHLRVRFKGGDRAPLTNPQTCGPKTTRSRLTSYAGHARVSESEFVVHGCAGVFAPSLEAGTANPLAGVFSPFTLTVRRPAGQPEIRTLAVDLPPGLVGLVAGVPLCPEPEAVSGACGRESRVGTATVQAGSGGQPYTLTGDVFLGGRYKGAPFNLIVVVRAIAGPFDLGTVVVRAPIHVDANRAKLDVPSDPIPTILEGVPIRLQTINITIDRPRFMVNATSCEPMRIGAVIGSVDGINHGVTVPYKAQDCASLPLEPKLDLELTDPTQTTDGKHPGLRAKLTQRPGEAGLRQVQVKLPLSLALDPDNAQALCTPQQAEQRACPESSIIGHATAVTPALNEPLSGPVYFVEGVRQTASGQTRRTLPNLWLKLSGEVELDLWARSDVVDDHLVTTFTSVPDAPISSFDMTLQGGRHGVLVVSNANLCEKPQVTQATFDGQNGKRHRSQIRMGLPCGFRIAKTTRLGPTTNALAVSGIGAGRLTVSGPGIRRTSRTIKTANVARINAQLTRTARRQLLRRGRLTRRVTVTFTPTGGKTRRITKTVTFRR